MMKRTTRTLVVLLALLCCSLLVAEPARGQEIRLATWNVENFHGHFAAHKATTQPINQDPHGKELVSALRKKNDEDNWQVSQVILDEKFFPDVLVIQEGPRQEDLRFFNRRWLNEAYETVLTLPSNTDRDQHLCLMMKKDFRILERRDRYYLEPDSVGNERGARLFARGPVFVKVRTPGGALLWVGNTHMKSKNVGEGFDTVRGQNEPAETTQKKIDAAKWRHREATRTHAIMRELEKVGPADVILLGDMNDTLGPDPYEPDAGGDALAALVGPPQAGFVLATRPLHEAGKNSFIGYWRDRHRELIDHVIVSRSLAPKVKDVQVFENCFTPVASDHFPVMVRIAVK